jgi:hypothetical protein
MKVYVQLHNESLLTELAFLLVIGTPVGECNSQVSTEVLLILSFILNLYLKENKYKTLIITWTKMLSRI